jgi:hypothetical protein
VTLVVAMDLSRPYLVNIFYETIQNSEPRMLWLLIVLVSSTLVQSLLEQFFEIYNAKYFVKVLQQRVLL